MQEVWYRRPHLICFEQPWRASLLRLTGGIGARPVYGSPSCET
jgi:hypothetical protein